MNFYKNRAINRAANNGRQPMPPTTGQKPAVTIKVNHKPSVELTAISKAVLVQFDHNNDGLGTFIVENAKPVLIPIINGVANSAEGFGNLLESLKGEYTPLHQEYKREMEEEALQLEEEEKDKKEEKEEEPQTETKKDECECKDSKPSSGNGKGEKEGKEGKEGQQPTYDMGTSEAYLRGWVGTVSRLLDEAITLSRYNHFANGAEFSLLNDDIYAVRDILKAMVNTARAINRKEGDVFSIERRPVGKIMLNRRVVTCYLLVIKTSLPKDSKFATEYSEDHKNGVEFKCALMRNGYRWLALPLHMTGPIVDELKPISYSHRVGSRTTRIIFGSLFGHGLISQVFKTASQTPLYFNDLNKLRF